MAMLIVNQIAGSDWKRGSKKIQRGWKENKFELAGTLVGCGGHMKNLVIISKTMKKFDFLRIYK